MIFFRNKFEKIPINIAFTEAARIVESKAPRSSRSRQGPRASSRRRHRHRSFSTATRKGDGTSSSGVGYRSSGAYQSRQIDTVTYRLANNRETLARRGDVFCKPVQHLSYAKVPRVADLSSRLRISGNSRGSLGFLQILPDSSAGRQREGRGRSFAVANQLDGSPGDVETSPTKDFAEGFVSENRSTWTTILLVS